MSINNTIKSEESNGLFVENKKPLSITEKHLKFLNERLSKIHPQKILEWAILTLPGLYQTTAFGLTGLAIVDMISKISYEENESNPQHLVPLIFLDTLYHFQETLDLTESIKSKYNVPILVYKPVDCDTVQDFERNNGRRLWETDEDSYDFLVKVEPARRAYEELGVLAVITGRRRSQKGDRENLDILEIDATGLIKINPLAHWDFPKVRAYIRANEIPYNALIDQGYRSIGDWHSTKPINDDNTMDERSGRWQGKNKTECGLHKDYFKMRTAFIASQKKRKFSNNSSPNNTLEATIKVT